MRILVFKWISVVILAVTTVAFFTSSVPPYKTFSEHDKLVWGAWLTCLTITQAVFLMARVRRCYACRIWGDFFLQLTGFTFIILSGLFGATYPPFSWAMGAFPVVGVIYLVVGRSLSKRSRYCKREYDGRFFTSC